MNHPEVQFFLGLSVDSFWAMLFQWCGPNDTKRKSLSVLHYILIEPIYLSYQSHDAFGINQEDRYNNIL